MRDEALPFGYLAVIPPDAPRGNIRSQDVTADRLARHVAVLFGVDVPDNPAGRTWVADYERLRVNEIARGALSAGPEMSPSLATDAGLDVIATATLQKYGPDNKAALVLAGCETLLNSVMAVFHDVLGIIGVSKDAEPVANTTLLAAWSLLVADLFRAQPALMAAAMKARAVQAEAYLEWATVPSSLPLTPSERPRDMSSTTDPRACPRELSVLDRTLPSELTLLSPHYGKDASNRMLVKSLVNNWCGYILGSADQAVAWITSDPREPESHRADTYLAFAEPARTFVSDVLAVSPFVRPMSDEIDRSDDPVLFLRSEEREGKIEHQSHADRLLPRMYSTPEVKNLPSRSQRALLMTHMRILQLFRGGEDFSSAYLRSQCRQHAGAIVQIAKRLLGETDPLTIALDMHRAAMDHSDLSETLDPDDAVKLYKVFVDGYASISSAWSAGIVSDGMWITLLTSFSSELRQAAEYIDQREGSKGPSLRQVHAYYWNAAIHDTGLKDAWELALSDKPGPLPRTALSGLIHNYLAIPFRSDDPREVMRYLKFSLNKLIPLREQVMHSRKSETPYRITLQTTVRPIYNLLSRAETSPADEAWLVEAAEDLEDRLLKTDVKKYLFDKEPTEQRDPKRSDLNYLGSLARAQVSILEHWHLASMPSQTLLRAAATIRVAWETYARVLQLETAQLKAAVSAASGTKRFSEYEDYERRVKVVAEGKGPAVAPKISKAVGEMLSQAEEIRLAVTPAVASSSQG